MEWFVPFFTQLNNYKLFSLCSDQSFCNTDSNENCLVLNPLKILSHLFHEFNDFMPNPNNNPANLANYKCEISQVKTRKTCDDYKSLSTFYLNMCSLSKNFGNFNPLSSQQILILMLLPFQNQELIKRNRQ